MRSTIITLVIAILSCSFTHLQAQEEAPVSVYNVVDYIKVKPGMQEDYLKLEKTWKKIHEAKIKSDMLAYWTLSVILSPAGAGQEYNFITRNMFRGDDQMANYYEGDFFPENWEALLTDEEKALVARTGEIRSIVKTEVWQTTDGIMPEESRNAKIQVFNFFDFPEGKGRADHVKMEKDIWKPVHQARIDDGAASGWVLLRMTLPYGAAMPYHDATVDVYKDMKQYLSSEYEKYFEKVHSGKDMDKMFEETNANSILLKSEVRMKLDQTE